MSVSERLHRVHQIALNPWVIVACIGLGGLLGAWQPRFSMGLAVIGEAYIDLLKMIVLPFMMSSVIFSLQTLFHEGGAGKIAKRVLWVFILVSLVAAAVPGLGLMTYNPGADLPEATRNALAGLVGVDADRNNIEMTLRAADEPVRVLAVRDVITSLIPSNIFASLANGEALKALIFALLFGAAAGGIPARVSDGLKTSLETVYRTCQTLTRWANLPIPLVLVCMTASQIATTGVEPLIAMSRFVLAYLVPSVAIMALATLVLKRRANCSLRDVLSALREPFALGIATNNSATCMPAMMAALADDLKFARFRVELLVPLTVSILRAGVVAYLICATMFIAALYGRQISADELALLMLVSALTGFASAGMAGTVTVTLVGTACSYLSVPFEAAFILFAAVDPLCAMIRTGTNVVVGCAAIAVVCPEPLKL